MAQVPRKELTLFDSTCLIVGIIIGAGIYRSAPDIAGLSGCWQILIGMWLLGGVLSLFGALGYAELATAYPREGGDYVYLSRAYGGWAGFLFGWIQMAVVRPGDIAIMAFAFATYGVELYSPFEGERKGFALVLNACLAVIILTAINVIGVKQGKWTQNILTSVKALGLLAIAGVAIAAPAAEATSSEVVLPGVSSLSTALILVLFTFGGWNEMAYVAAEVKDSRRNIVRALVLGTVAVTVLYLLVNFAFLYTLGYEKMTTSKAVAAEAVSTVFPNVGAGLISALVCISALGAVNGLIFAGARISYAVGRDHRLFDVLGRWHPRTGTPATALVLQGCLAVLLIISLGSFVDTIIYVAPAVYLFYFATSLAVIVLRIKEPEVERPYRVTGYPVTTIIFMAVCAFLIYSAVDFAINVLEKPWIVAVPFSIIPLGLPIYFLSSRGRAKPPE